MTKERQFILTLNYKSNASDWDVISHDVIEAKDLVSLITQFNVLIASLHRKILEEEAINRVDDDVPF